MAVRAFVIAPAMAAAVPGSGIGAFYSKRLTVSTPPQAGYPRTTRAGMTRQRPSPPATPVTREWGEGSHSPGTAAPATALRAAEQGTACKILHLVTARVVKPKISGDVLEGLIFTGADSKFGVDCLPPGATMRIAAHIMIRGFPGRVRKNPPDLAAVLAVADDEGNEQRVKLP
jgi:hypothetical protein